MYKRFITHKKTMISLVFQTRLELEYKCYKRGINIHKYPEANKGLWKHSSKKPPFMRAKNEQ